MSKSIKNGAHKRSMVASAVAAGALSAVLITPQFGMNGSALNAVDRDANIVAACDDGGLFSSMGEHGSRIALIGASAVRQYEQETGEFPSENMLACAYGALENLFSGMDKDAPQDNLLSSLNADAVNTTKGIDIRANAAAITLPAILMNPMNDAITYIPNPKHNEVELFNIERVAGSNFGGLKRGDIIDSLTSGKYSQLRQRFDLATQPDGTETTLHFDSATEGMALKTPMLNNSVKIYVNKKLVASDMNGDGSIFGKVDVGGVPVAISGDVDYALGKIDITTSTALPAASMVTARFDIDIEADPSLIPSIEHKMESFKLRPSQRVIAASATVMAQFTMDTEYSINQRALNLTSMRNTVVDEKARNQMEDIYWATNFDFEFDAAVPDGNDWRVDYEKLNAKLNEISTHLLTETKETGLMGIYAGKTWARFVKSLPANMFEPVRGYRQTANIHYCGMLFGKYRVYEVPQEGLVPADEFIGYAKSNSVGKCGYLTGDVIPPTLYSHEVTKGLIKNDTLWALGYDEVHPRDGEKFFVKCKLKNYVAG